MARHTAQCTSTLCAAHIVPVHYVLHIMYWYKEYEELVHVAMELVNFRWLITAVCGSNVGSLEKNGTEKSKNKFSTLPATSKM